MKIKILLLSFLIAFALGSEKSQGQSWRELLNQADSLSELELYDTSLILVNRALQAAESQFGESDTTIALISNRLGHYYTEKAEYGIAEEYLKKSLGIWEATVGVSNAYGARCLRDLAALYTRLTMLPEAESLAKQSLNILEDIYEPTHPEISNSQLVLAGVYFSKGRFVQALDLYKQVIMNREMFYGSDHPEVAEALIGLGRLYVRIGEDKEAMSLVQRALIILEKAYGADSPRLWRLYNTLGMVSELPQAKHYYERSLALAQQLYGPKHSNVAAVSNNLGRIYTDLKKYTEAEQVLLKALEINQKTYGPIHISICTNLHNLARNCIPQDKYVEAESLLKVSLFIKQQLFGPEHSHVIADLEQLRNLYRKSGELTKSVEVGSKATEMRLRDFHNSCRYVLSENEAIVFSAEMRFSLFRFLSSFFDGNISDENTLKKTADLIFTTKGVITDGIIQREKLISEQSDSTIRSLSEALKLAKRELNSLYIMGPNGKDPAKHKKNLDSLYRHIDHLETQFARRSNNFRKVKETATITTQEIAQSIPENSLLIEYMRYAYYFLSGPKRFESRYLVTALDKTGNLIIKDIGPAEIIDSLVSKYLNHFQKISKQWSSLSSGGQREMEVINDSLYLLIWKPIVGVIRNPEMVLIAPDGALNLLSFGTLKQGNEYLIERYTLHYLSAGRDLLRLKEIENPGRGLLALGDPDYFAPFSQRAGYSSPELAEHMPTRKGYQSLTRNLRSDCDYLSEIEVNSLPYTRREVEQVSNDWKLETNEPAFILLGSRASEDNFKKYAPGFRAIYLATHGFFRPGQCEGKSYRIQEGEVIWQENPLLQSGIFLAGSNLHGARAEESNAEDGILTALEVSTMNLTGTGWVVLSACESGLGEIQSAEGVFGLRRAFQLAGARTVISSLWPIPDKEVSQIMGHLYRLESENLAEALQSMAKKTIKDLRNKGLPDHPYLWGAFVATGDWRW